MTLAEIFMAKLQQALREEDRLPKYRGHPNILRGQCYVAAEVLYHWNTGLFKSYSMRVGDEVHWFLRSRSGKVYDPTAGQFSEPLDYSKGVGRGFLTNQPSKRAQRVMERMA